MSNTKYFKKFNFPYYNEFNGNQKCKTIINNQKFLNFGSNDYLSLSFNKEVIEAGVNALQKYGVSCCGSRVLNGTTSEHILLENNLKKYFEKEDCLVFSTGMLTNFGVMTTIKGTYFCDELNHASIIDALKLSNNKVIIYKHNDIIDLEDKLKDDHDNKIIVSDGVFSMKGDIVDLPALVKLKKKYNTLLIIDDAHGIGVLGKQGIINYYNINIKEIDLLIGVFSKAFGGVGGFVVGNKEHIDEIRWNARSIIFTASLPPSTCASVNKALSLIPTSHQKIKKVINYFIFKLKESNIDIKTKSAIFAFKVKDDKSLFILTKKAKENNIYLTPIVYPAVKRDNPMIRCSLTASCTKKDIDILFEFLNKHKNLLK